MACNSELRRTLENNLGRTVTVFPTAGGCAGNGFTGVLGDVGDTTVRLISMPCCGTNRGCRCGEESRVQTIPIDRIACVTTSQF